MEVGKFLEGGKVIFVLNFEQHRQRCHSKGEGNVITYFLPLSCIKLGYVNVLLWIPSVELKAKGTLMNN
jgi:hypothetical protein